jgi:3-dehydroshikimate dehydratase
MIKSGLVSITFRKLTFLEIINLVKKAGLSAIEWGGDIHIPHGDLQKAHQVHQATVDADVEVAAYGSYYVVGHSCAEGLDFEKVLETAVELRAPTIRVWAGKTGSAGADKSYWTKVVAESRKIAELAAAEKIDLSFEFHRNTLADTAKSALRLIQDISQNNFKMYWQPEVETNLKNNVRNLNMMLPYITNVHVFHWNADRTRCLLSQGCADWKVYLEKLSSVNKSRYAMIEFVKDDAIENFIKDTAMLKSILCSTSEAD